MRIARRAAIRILIATVFGVVLSPLASTWSALDAQTGPVCSGGMARFKLISAGVGWYMDCPAFRFFWTKDNGRNWTQIRSLDDRDISVEDLFFVDRQNGWLLATDRGSGPGDQHFKLLHTRNGGATWRITRLRNPLLDLEGAAPSRPTQIFFFDANHGWILWRWALMNSSKDALMATSDGGNTWHRLPDPPGPGPLQFISPSTGWMIGERPDVEDPPVQGNAQLWSTTDGGRTWTPISVSLPKDTEDEGTYLVGLKFRDSKQGMLAAGLEDTEGGATLPYVSGVTKDGGKTWRFSRFSAMSAEPSFGRDHIFWSAYLDPSFKTVFYMDAKPISIVPPSTVLPEGRFIDMDFFDDTNAWLMYSSWQGLALLATADSGTTFTVITPPISSGQTPMPRTIYRPLGPLLH
ncbi:MAG TPA: hypothetical protein VMB47_10880 [Candidatus Aquilonibacter sp.]|nr:hypothetical protein [Candidatus Aquilonibacter sp.]